MQIILFEKISKTNLFIENADYIYNKGEFYLIKFWLKYKDSPLYKELKIKDYEIILISHKSKE